MAKITIDNSGNKWPGTVSIADLAQFTPLLVLNSSKDIDIYEVEDAMNKAWRFEIADFEYEYATGYSATFKDGSIIHIGAWKTEPYEEDDSIDTRYR
jgi:hypothetical protein